MFDIENISYLYIQCNQKLNRLLNILIIKIININLFYNLIYSNQWLYLFFKFYLVKKKKEDKRKEIYSKKKERR